MSVRLSAALSGAVETQLAARTRILENGAASVGWKMAASIPGIDADEGVDGSIFGFLTSDTTLTAGSQVDAGVTVDLCAEVELEVEVGHDVIRTPTSTRSPQPSRVSLCAGNRRRRD